MEVSLKIEKEVSDEFGINYVVTSHRGKRKFMVITQPGGSAEDIFNMLNRAFEETPE